jgi:hypothetical protein
MSGPLCARHANTTDPMRRAAAMSASHRRAGIRSPAKCDRSEVNARASGNAPGEVNLATGRRAALGQGQSAAPVNVPVRSRCSAARRGIGQPQPGGCTDDYRADDGEDVLPHLRRRRERGKAVRRVEPSDRGRSREQHRKDETEERCPDQREGGLRRGEGRAAGKESERDGAERTCSAVVGEEPGGGGDKKWQGINGKRENSQQKTPSPTRLRTMPIAIMVVHPVTRVQGSRLPPPPRRDVKHSKIDPLWQQNFCGALSSRRIVFEIR